MVTKKQLREQLEGKSSFQKALDKSKKKGGGSSAPGPPKPTPPPKVVDVGAGAKTGGTREDRANIARNRAQAAGIPFREPMALETPEEIRQAQRLTPEGQAETAELQGLSRIDELTGQVLQPDLDLRTSGTGEAPIEVFGGATRRQVEEQLADTTPVDIGGGVIVDVPKEQVLNDQMKKETKSIITTNIDKNSNIVQIEAQAMFAQLGVRGSKIIGGGGLLDKRLSNMEQALVNHKEGSGDVVLALQAGAYDPIDAITDTNNMVDDVAIVEETMRLLKNNAPGVYAENKGWEYTTRITKIRRSLLTRQQQILNIAETGSPLPDDSGQLALNLNKLQTG